MAERDLIERLDDAVEAILAGRRDGLALSQPELATLLVVADDLRELPDPAFRSKLKAELIPTTEDEMTTMTAEEPKTGFHTITPYLLVDRADDLIAFMQDAFGAELLARHPAPDGRVMHAELRVGDSMIEMGEPSGEFKPMAMALHLYIDDVDAAYARALASGATTMHALTDQPYGDREGGVKDRWGNIWYLATHQENVTEDELQRRFAGGGSKPRKETGVGPRPTGYHTVTPFLHARGARALLTFLENAFGARVEHLTEMAGREVAHAGVRIGDSMIELGEAHGESEPIPAVIHLHVPDVDAVYERAVRAGATSVNPPEDKPYGERGAFVIDAFGNQWFIATAR
ncbi:MAG TPA: VOC family protein [Thermoanaerobaculia bacterium]|jgi:PhnB protein|nr:VOC family protein [Thermoanaerobaculia bacterium]